MIVWIQVVLAFASWACVPASAQDNPTLITQATELQGLTADDARRLLAILADENRRAQLMESLREIAGSSAPSQPSGPSVPSAPAGSPAPGEQLGPDRQSGSTEPSAASPNAGPNQPSGPGQRSSPAVASTEIAVAPAPVQSPQPAPAQPHAAPSPAPLAKPHTEPGPAVHWERNALGAQLLAQLSAWVRDLVGAAHQQLQTMTQYWRNRQQLLDAIESPTTLDRLREIAWRLAAVLAISLAFEWLVVAVLRRPQAALAKHVRAGVRDREAFPDLAGPEAGTTRREPLGGALARLPLAMARLVLDLIPVLIFAAVANLLAGTALADADVSRLIIVAVANAYAFTRAIMCVVRTVIGSDGSGPSMLAMPAATAAYVERWARYIVAVAVFGLAAADTGLLLGLDAASYGAMVSIVALAGHVLAAIIIMQCRRPVAAMIRGPVDDQGVVAQLRLWLAGIWHIVAIAVDFALWAVWSFGFPNGYLLLLRLLLVSAAIVILARLAVIALAAGLDRLPGAPIWMAESTSALSAPARRYRAVLRQVLSAVIFALALVVLLEAWGVDALSWFRSGLGNRLLAGLATIGVAAGIAVIVWEASNVAIERHLARLTHAEQYPSVVRLRTLLPVLRAVLLWVILVIVGLTALAEIGVDIAPLLAGAGIIGIAIGFGSQKLVSDVITGLFLMVENSMQVGEWVSAGGVSGNVERLTIRTVQLRGLDGALHVIPYSSISTVSNTNRGTGNAAVSISVAEKQDTDRIGEVLKEIAADMRADPRFAGMMRGDLDLWGVDRIEGSMVTIAGQIVCTDRGRWPVQREFNRRVKIRFEQLGIEFAIPTHRIVLEAQPAGTVDAPDRLAPKA